MGKHEEIPLSVQCGKDQSQALPQELWEQRRPLPQRGVGAARGRGGLLVSVRLSKMSPEGCEREWQVREAFCQGWSVGGQ